MARLLGSLLRWSLVPPLALLAFAMAGSFLAHARGALGPVPAAWCGAGFLFRAGAGMAFRRFGKDDPFHFLDTLEHELTHALVGYLTFCPPVSLSATLKSGGEVELKGANPLAVLAPYCLPLWGLAAALTGLAVKPGLQSAWTAALCFLIGCFAWRLVREFGWRQTDLHAYGFAFSTVTVAVLLLLDLGLLFWMRGALGWEWLPAALRRAFALAAGIAGRGSGASAPAPPVPEDF